MSGPLDSSMLDLNQPPMPPSNHIVREYARIVKRLSLENFLCFSFIAVDFNHYINGIIGSKGTGKSSIQRAIFAALGAEEPSNLKRLVRNGSTQCQVELVLNNIGSLSFQHAKYGNEIIIHRQFDVSGNSLLKLKSDKGVVVSSKEEDLEEIMFFFNMKRYLISIINRGNISILLAMSAKEKYDQCFDVTNLDIEEVPTPPKLIETVVLDNSPRPQTPSRQELQLEIDKLRDQKSVLDSERVEWLKKEATVVESLTWAKTNDSGTAAKCEEVIKAIKRQLGKVDTDLVTINNLVQEKQRAMVLLPQCDGIRQEAVSVASQSQLSTVATPDNQTSLRLIDVKTKLLEKAFQKVLLVRKFYGKLLVDHASGQIKIMACVPDEASNCIEVEVLSVVEEELHLLSNETKSFFAAAFLLALWKVADQPLISIDDLEFFMGSRVVLGEDQKELDLLMELMFEMSCDKPECQFIISLPKEARQNRGYLCLQRCPETSLIWLDGRNEIKPTKNNQNGEERKSSVDGGVLCKKSRQNERTRPSLQPKKSFGTEDWLNRTFVISQEGSEDRSLSSWLFSRPKGGSGRGSRLRGPFSRSKRRF